ncbi:MAG: hypothetical protein DBX47_05425 [Clostridiales bacterium]|nr:MAG: hypothetical protein DBX47_05425 [Clostridiales bacterium]
MKKITIILLLCLVFTSMTVGTGAVYSQSVTLDGGKLIANVPSGSQGAVIVITDITLTSFDFIITYPHTGAKVTNWQMKINTYSYLYNLKYSINDSSYRTGSQSSGTNYYTISSNSTGNQGRHLEKGDVLKIKGSCLGWLILDGTEVVMKYFPITKLTLSGTDIPISVVLSDELIEKLS